MRALWLIPAVLAFSVAAGAGNTVGTARGSTAHSYGTPSGRVSGNWSGVGGVNRYPHWRGMAYRVPRTRVVYVLPYVQPQYVEDDNSQPMFEDPGYAQTEYIQQPETAVAAPATPAAPPIRTVQYLTSGDATNIPPGAHVTKGSLYKYTKNGVNTYTNMPPPANVDAKTLFSYTEVDAPIAAQTVYRCAGAKPGQINYSGTPIPNKDCKPVGYAGSPLN
ncbi:MAG TPA: hypothetical protein VK660_04850 [Xanthomonadaceae bacterium]|nr:hypothetical protein [Xanthomonadaceae bacterium]